MRLNLPVLAVAASTMALGGCGMFRHSEPPQAQVTLRIADAAMSAGAPDMALRVADLVLRRQPKNVAAMVAKGDALYAMGASDQAAAAYRSAVAADPTDPGAQIGLGRTLVRTDPHGAETAFLAALARQPDNLVALNNLGIARDMQGHHDAAQQAYRQALAVAPESTDVQTNLGLSLALSGQGARAVQVLQPVATAPEAGPLKQADLAVAVAQAQDVGRTGPVQEQAVETAVARYDTPIEISPAPIASVQRQVLPARQARTIPQTAPVQPVKVARVEPDAKPAAAPIPAAAHAPIARKSKPAADGYAVQMASLDSEQAARAEWQKMRSRWPDLLADRVPAVVQADVHDRMYWRLRTGGFPNFGEASGFCARMHAVGSGCWTIAPDGKS